MVQEVPQDALRSVERRGAVVGHNVMLIVALIKVAIDVGLAVGSMVIGEPKLAVLFIGYAIADAAAAAML
jgi:hypothetical protein